MSGCARRHTRATEFRSRRSANTEWTCCPTPAVSNRLGVVDGGWLMPVTSAPRRASQSDSHPPLNPVWPVTSARTPRYWSKSATLPHRPGRTPVRPETRQMLVIARRVHAVPEMLVTVGHQLAVAGQLLERFALEHKIGTIAEPIEHGAREDEEPAADPVSRHVRLLVELGDTAAPVQCQLAKLPWRMDRHHGCQPPMTPMKSDDLTKIDVGHAIAVGDDKQIVGGRHVARGLLHARACLRVEARFRQRDRPVAFGRARVELRRARREIYGDVADHRREVEEILFEEVGPIAEAEDELVKAPVRKAPHDVPHDRPASDWHH